MAQDSLSESSLTLGTLIASRICHDIISPIGAISNGLELVALTGNANTPEMELIEQSVAGANARVRFYRVALGLASHEQKLGPSEIKNILAGYYADTRFTCAWRVSDDVPRDEVQALLLALLCVGSGLPLGGELVVQRDGDVWEVSGTGKQSRTPEALWAVLSGRGDVSGLQPSEVQFAMLPRCTQALERVLTHQVSETGAQIRF